MALQSFLEGKSNFWVGKEYVGKNCVNFLDHLFGHFLNQYNFLKKIIEIGTLLTD